jgi:hypothetical protein
MMICIHFLSCIGPLWSWSYGNWSYNYLCNQCLSPLKSWVRIPLRRGDTVCQWFATGRWYPPGTTGFYTYKADRLNITEIFWKVALNTIILTLLCNALHVILMHINDQWKHKRRQVFMISINHRTMVCKH